MPAIFSDCSRRLMGTAKKVVINTNKTIYIRNRRTSYTNYKTWEQEKCPSGICCLKIFKPFTRYSQFCNISVHSIQLVYIQCNFCTLYATFIHSMQRLYILFNFWTLLCSWLFICARYKHLFLANTSAKWKNLSDATIRWAGCEHSQAPEVPINLSWMGMSDSF